MNVQPLSIILVKSDSKGDRLLFRYPFAPFVKKDCKKGNKSRNPYTLRINEDLLQTQITQDSNIKNGQLSGFTDEVLSTLFAVKSELCEKKFELKVNDVRFVGHPSLIVKESTNDSDTYLINIQFALHANANHSVVKCYYDLSRRLGGTLKYEEARCRYVSKETKIMTSAHDDCSSHVELDESPFDLILKRSVLARDLKKVYDDISITGEVYLKINKWVEFSFCLPQKVHQFYNKDFIVEPETIEKWLKSLRPYHGLLLLIDKSELLSGLPPDSSPALRRLIKVYSPLHSFQRLAMDADLELSQVFQIAGHLVYWAKATIIYPLCESNVYVVSPDAPTCNTHTLAEKFNERFPGQNLLQLLCEFSMPTTLSQRVNPLQHPQQHTQLVLMMIWMLQHRLLLQLHTYVYFMPPVVKSNDQAETDPVNRNENKGNIFEEKTKLLSGLTQDEKSCVLKVPAAANSDDLTLFARISKHFKGKSHLEEIMYLENLRRSQILQLIDKFRDVLITCQTEDPDIATFSHSRKNYPGVRKLPASDNQLNSP